MTPSVTGTFFPDFPGHMNPEPACMKVQAHSSLKLPLKYIQYQIPLMNQGCYDLNHLGSYENIMQLQISSRKENR